MAIPHYVQALITGVDELRWNRGEALGSPVNVSFSFLASLPDYANSDLHPRSGDASPETFRPFTEAQRAATLDILRQYSEVANITFEQRPDDARARIHFAGNHQPDSLAYAYYPWPNWQHSGDVWLGEAPGNSRVAPGQQGYATLLHEVGHALGLKHPFKAQPGGSDAVLWGVRDSEQYTVMSYSLHPHAVFTKVGAGGGIVYRDIESSTPMLYDIAAVQYLYGANYATRAGDDLYAFSPDKPFLMCIWDGGGKDTVSVAGFELGCRIDLRAGRFSDITILSAPVANPDWEQPTYDGTDNLSIAFGVTLENATGGAGGDTLRGNGARNTLRGNGGDDTLVGGAGADRLAGGEGADVFSFDRPHARPDLLVDFQAGVDVLELDDAGYAGLAGRSAEQSFTDHFLQYDPGTGNLYYDADGAANEFDPVPVATLSGNPALAPGDVRII